MGGSIVFETSRVDLLAESDFPHTELPPGSYIVLAVSDTGVGMDAETKEKIFDPFFTTKGTGKGTGLGLSTVYGIVKQSGGHISVSSEIGYGATFRIYLPASQEPPTVDPHREAARPALEGTEAVLVVEDEEAVRRMVTTVLTQSGYVVHAEPTPSAAMRYAESVGRIDLLVSDVVLPGMNGRLMAEAMRARHPSLKVLFISGYTEKSSENDGLPFTNDDFLQKPFAPAVLATKVREVLDKTP